MDIMWIMLAVLVVVITLWLAMIMPARSTKEQRAPFCGRMYAHRGLFSADQRVPENSLAAFRAAVEAGYGVELDVQLTRDKRVVVFHDDDLKRACGVDARVDAYTFEELQQLSLFGTTEKIPLFSDVLDAIGGRIPIIVELKSGGDWQTLCRETQQLLQACKGDFCVESFHPMLVRWFYLHAPQILRGQLSEAARFSRKGLPLYQALLMSRLLTNILTHPQFIAYRVGPKCLSVRLSEGLGAMRVAWTARPTDDHAALTRQNDAIIFEHYRPDTHY
jgi:glycerophosphoryl diester phosphodiesterase